MRYSLLLSLLLLPLHITASEPLADSSIPRSAVQQVMPVEIPEHPRLLASVQDWRRVREQVETDEVSRKLLEALKANAEKVLKAEPVERVVTGRRLLSVSRTALQRVMLLSALYKVTEEERYAERAKEELQAVAGFSDWNPSHFLDVAEMAYAVAVGYDWLYDYLDEETRGSLERALVEMAIKPSFLDEYDYWTEFTNNWNQVCHAGISAAAIALADLDPELTEKVLRRAINNVPAAGAAYGPDGAFPEGPMYWSYATQFHLLFVQSLETFSGDDFGIGSLPGINRTGGYIDDMTAPSGNYFNYGDSSLRRPFHIPMFWLAARFNNPEWLEHDITNLEAYLEEYVERSNERLMPMALLWRRPELKVEHKPSSGVEFATYRGETPVAVFRVGEGPRALYAAIKAGSPSVSHGQMDVGAFIIETDGVRWAVDLGLQGYHSIERLGMNLWDNDQDSERWTIFRLGPESHNIPRFDGSQQLVQASSEIFKHSGRGENDPFAVMDLSFIYRRQVKSAMRGMRLIDGKAILVQDEWSAQGGEPINYAWQMLTRADSIEVRDDRVELRQDGEIMTLRVLDEMPFVVSVEDTDNLIQPFDEANPGVTRLSITTPAAASGRLRILFVPGSAGEIKVPPARELTEW